LAISDLLGFEDGLDLCSIRASHRPMPNPGFSHDIPFFVAHFARATEIQPNARAGKRMMLRSQRCLLEERSDLGRIHVINAAAGMNGTKHGAKDLASGSHFTLRQKTFQ
jgi:hypothetical protein